MPVYPGKLRISPNDHEQFATPPNAAAVTPSDTADLSNPGQIWVGGAGNVKVDMLGTGTAISFVGLDAGQFLPVIVKRVYNTDTTATNIVVVY